MLYIFDMGNVIIDIDFNRVFDKWSELSGTSEEIKSRFTLVISFNYMSVENFRHRVC